jgi:hypothetical protein
MARDWLRRGDRVEVKSPIEILATLDAQGTLDGLPFMPEMVAFCGRHLSVDGRAERICDTIAYSGTRRLEDTVLLEDLRCDGSGHGGCQAECRLFWKEAWLRKVAPGTASASAFPPAELSKLMDRVSRNARWTAQGERSEEHRYRCQATEHARCSAHVPLWDARSYAREYTRGNVPLKRFLRVVSRAAVQEPMRKLGLIPEIPVPGTARKGDSFETLDLEPGELVRIKSKEEIAKTLREGRNKGLWFDREMLVFCGEVFRVRRRVHRFINEPDGKMVTLQNEAITLEDVVCSGERSLRRWFCPRAIYPYWRECWLERAEDARAAKPRAEPQKTALRQ